MSRLYGLADDLPWPNLHMQVREALRALKMHPPRLF